MDELTPTDVRETSIDRTLSAALDALTLSRASPGPVEAAPVKEDPDASQPPTTAAPEIPVANAGHSQQTPEPSRAQIALFSAPACTLHTYIRTSNSSTIVERPQRLRAVAVGLACALARLEETFSYDASSASDTSNLTIAVPDFVALVPPTMYRDIDIRTHDATRYVHNVLAALEEERTSDSTEKVYLDRLHDLVSSCLDKIALKQSEIPAEWPQGDLYLSPGSMAAFQSSIATVCAAVDMVTSLQGPRQAFAAVRPPGHHCSSAQPSGFCFLNNVAIAAVHAHLHHSITHVAILDIDLHHGNGTQAITWAINAETHKQASSLETYEPAAKPGLQVYYGSIHDILSYPCETGDPALTQAASICIHGAHGQHIENIHLEPYTSDEDFWGRLYPEKYSQLLKKADDFFERTDADPGKSMIFVSCGFDACSHELVSMSRHKRNVPPTFYGRFAADAHALAAKRAGGKTLTVLEGGYGDRALQSGAMAYLVGMFSTPEEVMERQSWWGVEELVKIEKTFPPPKGNRRAPQPSASAAGSPYLSRASSLLPSVFPPLSPEEQPLPFSAPTTPAQPHRMGLRDRKTLKPPIIDATPPRTEGHSKPTRAKRGAKSSANTPTRLPPSASADGPSPLTTPTTETLPPLPVTGLDGLMHSMGALDVSAEPQVEHQPITPSTEPPQPQLTLSTAATEIGVPSASQPPLKFKLRVPPAVLQQLRGQAGVHNATEAGVPVKQEE